MLCVDFALKDLLVGLGALKRAVVDVSAALRPDRICRSLFSAVCRKEWHVRHAVSHC